jgi:hypothetical protein
MEIKGTIQKKIALVVKSFRQIIIQTIDLIKWEFYEGLSKKFYFGMFSDWKNFFCSLPFFFLNFFVLGIIGFIFLLIVEIVFPNPYVNTLLILIIGVIGFSIQFAILSALFDVILTVWLLTVSYQKSVKFPELLNAETHTGIFFLHYDELASECFTADCIALLIENFQKYQISYKVYHCYNRNDFENHYIEITVTKLWIIGHGEKKGIRINKDILEYSLLPLVHPKECIAQLHCNPGDGPSLIDINRPRTSFVTNFNRMTFQNRTLILNYFKRGNFNPV